MDTNFRSVFSLSGPDRVRYLNAVTTGNIRDLAPGQSTSGWLLNAQGHILAELVTLALEDRLLVLGHAIVRQRTFATLDKFIIMDDATLTDETAQTGTLAIEGPRRAEIVREIDGSRSRATRRRGAHVAAQMRVAGGAIPCRVMRHSLFGFPGAEFLVRREALGLRGRRLGAAVRARGGAPIGYRALNALRLEAGIPWYRRRFRRAADSARGGNRIHAHQLHQGLLHRAGDRGAGALARARQPAARRLRFQQRGGAETRDGDFRRR